MTHPTDFRADEKRLPVVGYEGLYSVSSLGRVRSEDRTVPNGSGRRLVKGRVLRQHRNTKGYFRVDLSKRGQVNTARVHVLVAEAFLGPRPDGMCVLHGDLGQDVNAVHNLSYGTLSQNNGADRIRDGTDNRGPRNGNAKLTPSVIAAIRSAVGTHASLAKVYGVSATTIYQIRLGKRWAHVA